MKRNKEISGSEKLVLYSLVKFPSSPDIKIADRLGMSVSTFASIKDRLIKKDLFQTINIPVFSSIGCELFMVSYGNLNRASTIEHRLSVTKKLFDESREYFFIISESNQAVNLAVARNYTDYDKDIQQINQLYMEHDFFDDGGFKNVAFPFEISTIFNFFNYAPFLNNYFDLGFKENWLQDDLNDSGNCRHKVTSTVDMTNKEKEVYVGLIEYPELSDGHLSKKIKISRNTVAKFKKSLFEDGLMIKKRIPNLNLLGIKLLGFTHITFNPRTTVWERKKAIEKAQKILTPILFISKNMDGIMLIPYRDFEDSQLRYGEVLSVYKENDFIEREPVSYSFSVPRMTLIKDHVYAPLMRKLLLNRP